MAHDDEPLSPREIEAIDEWIEQTMRDRPLQPGDERETPTPQFIRELQRAYQEEAQAVDRRLERVWHRLEQRVPAQQSQRETLSRALPAVPHERRQRIMSNPFPRLPFPRNWSSRVSALAAAALLIVLVGGLTAGIILVRHGGSNTQSSLTPTPATTPTPPPTPTPPSANLALYSIEMKDTTQGWATAEPNPYTPGAPEHILHTSDGGMHWKDVTPQPAQGAQLNHALLSPQGNGSFVRTEDFLTGSVAWVASADYTKLFGTTNGGQTWQAVVAPGDSMRQFTFLDALNGWVISEANGTVGTFQTTDGGAHWTRLQSSANAFPLQTPFWGVSFLNATTGWAVFLNTSLGGSVQMYKTVDGGATWQIQRLTLPGGATAPVSVNPPQFFDAKDGMIEVGFDGGLGGQFHQDTNNRPASGGGPEGLYFTQDGGATWQGPVILNGLEFPDFIDAQHGWALNGTGSSLLTTSDGGQHWATVPTNSTFIDVNQLSFVSSQIGWAIQEDVHANYSLLGTGNGGKTWKQINLIISN
jgi:photosystem II stability/assembly factor-like uncharacterized protein